MTGDTARQRKRRLASDEAHAWARNLRLGNAYAKSVLGFLAGYVNGDGICYVGIEELADDADLSMDTVRKRLAWLEQIGAIVRFPQWIDGNGKRNGDGRGKRTSDEIRLLIDADPDIIEARAKGYDEGGPASEIAPISPRSQQGLNPGEESVSPPVALCQPSDSGEGLISEPEPEDSPLSPPLGGEWPHEAGWKRFEDAWVDPILRQSIARQVWSVLTDVERELAIRAAQGYRLWRSQQRRPPNIINAHTFLREPDAWPGYAKLAPSATPANPKPRITFKRDSIEGRAIEALYTIARSSAPVADDGVVEFSGEMTPQIMALANAAPKREWAISDDHKQLGAWNDLLRSAINKTTSMEDHIVGKNTKLDAAGNEIFLGSVIKRGFRAPWPWPPRVDGSLCTGPPESTLTQEDESELTKL